MSKYLKCGDCVKYNTDACDYPSHIETDIMCPYYVVDIEEVYEKGRNDAIAELKEKHLFADAYNEGLADGREGVIEEFIKTFWQSEVEFRPSQIDEITRIAEQLKENSDGRD